MSLYKESIVTELFKENGTSEVIWYKDFRQAKREVLKKIGDVKSDVFGATFELVDGTFLKEIHL